ncbi:MAG: indolepyruvate ferredoxin oxidoreductase [Hyphomicrobiaceae bacterium]|jgi:indolepyruvate ferredoxin oxidoreductase
MVKHVVSLEDKFNLSETHQILTGTQAIVRLLLMQKQRDRAAGLNTAGYATGYRGSPIATLEAALHGVEKTLTKNNIKFQPGLNEDLSATAVWGTQQTELYGEGKFDGVFGLWYGKGPGVDRSGDVFRHANHAGTSPNGGVLALMGDDHTCESSTTAHQSEFAFVDAMMPIFNPAGVQEILDFGIMAYALSRYASVWVGLKCVKDNIESTATVDGNPDRVSITLPSDDEFTMPEGGLSIRGEEHASIREARLFDYKMDAVRAFVRNNDVNRIVTSGGPTAKIGIVSTGKSYLDVREALDTLGLDEVGCNEQGIRILKIGMPWPLDPQIVKRFAKDLDMIIVVEEKRALIEAQIKELLFNTDLRPVVIGKKNEHGNTLFQEKGALEATQIGIEIGERLLSCDRGNETVSDAVTELKRLTGNTPVTPEAFTRVPYFCAGCPHSSSTKVPEGSRAYAGIGCHYMAKWMDRETFGFTHMGAEGANWIGEASFTTRDHVFQNLGDGTYIHSGSLAIRAAVAAGVNITYKLLYNDAVAMTGGQALDGGLTVGMMAQQVMGEGVKRVDIVTDEPDKYGTDSGIPAKIQIYHRRDLMEVQKGLAATPGVTVMIYDQTCASEKRRRRKRGLFPDPDRRAFINTAVCEGCGDCGVKSNCVAVTPEETALGRKRKIDQSACNKDFSCVEGFCPSFVTVHGAKPKKMASPQPQGDKHAGVAEMLTSLPEPKQPALDKAYAMLVTGVGGTGVVTISAVLGQAAYIEGIGFGAIDMTGLAQKGGAVSCHLKFAKTSDDINAIRIGVGGANLVLGGDLVVTASNSVLKSVQPDETAIIVNTHEMITGEFTKNPDLQVPGSALIEAINDRARKADVHTFDAHAYAVRLFGDSIMSNMFLLGFAFQKGLIPVSAEAIEEAVKLNGAAIEMNQRAFRFGRLAAHDRDALDRIAKPAPKLVDQNATETLEDIIERRAALLVDYQDAKLAERYRQKVAWAQALEKEHTPSRKGFAEAVARSYHKLLAYKDEYEVARLYTDGAFAEALKTNFDGVRRIEYHLAPPLLARFWKDKTTGHPRKIKLGGWMTPVFRFLAKRKNLRGTAWDVFGRSSERRREREMITEFEQLLDRIGPKLSDATHATATVLAGLPMDVRGFGHVKLENDRKVQLRKVELLRELDSPSPVSMAAE